MEKKGLGRGLAALISLPEETEGGARVQDLPLSQLTANPNQPRTLFDPLQQQELAASIREHGVLQPILVRRMGHERYQIVAGERRFRASLEAGLKTIPALIKDLGNRETLEIAIVENVQRADIGSLEAARAYRQLIDEFGLTQEDVARRVGKSRSAVANVLGLLDLPEPIQHALEDGQISEGHARAMKVAKDEAIMLRVLEKTLTGSLSVRETERLVREALAPAISISPSPAGTSARIEAFSASSATSGVFGTETGANGNAPTERNGSTRSPSGRDTPDFRPRDPHEAHATDRLREALQTKVAIRHTSGGAGKIEIDFFSQTELDRLVEMLTGGR